LIKTTAPIRERAATLNLEDDDIVGIAVAPIKSTPPLAPRRTTAPPPPALRTSIPPAPASSVAPIAHMPIPMTAATRTPAFSFTPPPVPTFDAVDVDLTPVAPAPVAPASIAPPPASVAPPPVALAPVLASVAPPPASVAPPPASVAPPPVSMMRPVTPIVPFPAVTPAPVTRLSLTDPTDLIFDGMYDLTFARSMSEAAEMCAETLAKALGARAVVIHMHDLMSRELRAIGAHGDGDFDIIGSAEASDDDLVASAVICNQKSVTMTFDGELSALAPKRLHAVGAPRTLVAAPAMSWGRCLAIIEVIDADERYAARVADSATYVADHFAQFLCAHAA
jgi:hypothetical protein